MNSDLTRAFIWFQRMFTPRTFCLLSSDFPQWFLILHVFDSWFMEQMSSHCSTCSRSFRPLHDVWSTQSLNVSRFFTSTFQVQVKNNHVNNYLLRDIKRLYHKTNLFWVQVMKFKCCFTDLRPARTKLLKCSLPFIKLWRPLPVLTPRFVHARLKTEV